MTQEVNIELHLDTKTAQSDSRALNRTERQTRRRINTASSKRFISKSVSRGVAAMGGLSAIGRIKRTYSEVDPWSESLTPVMASVQQFVDKTLGYSARARMQALDQVRSDLAVYAQETGNMGVVRDAYANELKFTKLQEEGLSILRKDPRFAGPTLGDLLSKAFTGYFKLVGDSFDYLWNGIDGK